MIGAAIAMRFKPVRILRAGWLTLLLMPLWVLAYVWPGVLAAVAVGAVIGYAGLSFFAVAWETAIQDQVPHRVLARVASWDHAHVVPGHAARQRAGRRTRSRVRDQPCARRMRRHPADLQRSATVRAGLPRVDPRPAAGSTTGDAGRGRSGCDTRAGLEGGFRLTDYRSMTRSDVGCAQQTRMSPGTGGSRGCGLYVISPVSSGVVQVWQTPVRQDHLVGTSQASANSRTLRYASSNGTDSPLRANVMSGPLPGSPGGGCGAGRWASVMPGLMVERAPNSSVWIRAGSTPRAVRAVLDVGHEGRRAADVGGRVGG